jgi:hypothetical protein
VREALTVRSTAGTDQQAMVRDLCQGGAGVAVVAAVAAYQARNRVVATDSVSFFPSGLWTKSLARLKSDAIGRSLREGRGPGRRSSPRR